MERVGNAMVHLGPPRRGGPDSIREAVTAAVAGTDVRIMSQQFSDVHLVERLARLHGEAGPGAPFRVLVEHDYLVERPPVPPADLWRVRGSNEENRACLLALLRSDIAVRFDHHGSDLMHLNLVMQTEPEGGSVCMTSANLSPSSLDRHLNWAVRLHAPTLLGPCQDLMDAVWGGDFRDAQLQLPVTGGGSMTIDAQGGATRVFADLVEQATASVTFAFFNASSGSLGVDALVAASERGVEVRGVVDADQGNQTWDGVADLKDAGADVRYYPGARTGAVGRMHHKFAVVDDVRVHLSTANLSKAAEGSLEGCIEWPEAPSVAAMLQDEVARLHAGASVHPLAEAVL